MTVEKNNLDPVIEKIKNKILSDKVKTEDHDNIWPNEVKFILETVDLLENNVEMSDEVMDYFYNRAKKEDMDFYNFLKQPKITKMIRAEVQKIATPVFYINIEGIRERILKCITLINEASNNLDIKQIIDSYEYDLIKEIIGSFIWIFERIDFKNNTMRIKSISNFLIKCLVIKTNIVRLTHIFKQSRDNVNIESKLKLINEIPSEILLPTILKQYDLGSIINTMISQTDDISKIKIIIEIIKRMDDDNKKFLFKEIFKNSSFLEIQFIAEILSNLLKKFKTGSLNQKESGLGDIF
ncbi:MAG: hypothetical protein ACTSRP_11340 [Candidatus Helarchaeota archaeon]